VRNVDAKLAKTLGIAAGEVLIEINGRAVRSRNEALDIGKGDYKRGVRTFTTKWLANGAVVERTTRRRTAESQDRVPGCTGLAALDSTARSRRGALASPCTIRWLDS
jgi:hypothetical protein